MKSEECDHAYVRSKEDGLYCDLCGILIWKFEEKELLNLSKKRIKKNEKV